MTPASDLSKSIVRSLSGLVAGVVVYVASKLGVGNLSPAVSVEVAAGVVAVWSAGARALEQRWPKAGWLLGVPASSYASAKAVTVPAAALSPSTISELLAFAKAAIPLKGVLTDPQKLAAEAMATLSKIFPAVSVAPATPVVTAPPAPAEVPVVDVTAPPAA